MRDVLFVPSALVSVGIEVLVPNGIHFYQETQQKFLKLEELSGSCLDNFNSFGQSTSMQGVTIYAWVIDPDEQEKLGLLLYNRAREDCAEYRSAAQVLLDNPLSNWDYEG